MNFLYVIEELPSSESDEKTVKIGISSNVDKRLKSMQTGNSSELKILEKFPVGIGDSDAYKQEAMIHNFFGSKRGRGEWFHFDKKYFDTEVILLLKQLFPPCSTVDSEPEEKKELRQREPLESSVLREYEERIQEADYVDLKLLQIELEKLSFISHGCKSEDEPEINRLRKMISGKIREGLSESRRKDQVKLKKERSRAEIYKQRLYLESIAFGVLASMGDC